MSQSPVPGSVLLAEQRSASSVLHEVLAEGAAGFPQVFDAVRFPEDARAFRKRYAELLPRYEAARVDSAERTGIAAVLVDAMRRHLVWESEAGSVPLAEAVSAPAEPLALRTHEFDAAPGWKPSPVYRGRRWDPPQLAELGAMMCERNVITASAAEALAWVADHALQDGRLDLSGRRIAVLGANAEMAPTRFWLEAGADVLWLDVVPPPKDWLNQPRMAGRLHWPEGDVDLLARPAQVLATLREFAAGGPMDLGLYAYAPGQAREVRLTGVMNALVDALPPEAIASVTLLVSPSTATALGTEDLAAMARRHADRPLWEASLAALGVLGRGDGCVRHGGAAATRSLVPIQGASYQAAQYLGKVLRAECWAAGVDGRPPLRVSANTAAITRTRSLDHPVFAAAFGGAAAFGVETFTPRLSRCINGLLAVRDWLLPDAPVPGSIRVHGGIHTLPYPLESALRVAAAIGFARAPRLLRALFRR